MAVQTVVAFVSLVFMTTVISELSHQAGKFDLRTVQYDDDDGSGLGATDPSIAEDFADARYGSIRTEGDGDTDDLSRGFNPVVPGNTDDESEVVDPTTFINKGAEVTSISTSPEKWTSHDMNGLSDSQNPRSNGTLISSLENPETKDTPSDNLMDIREMEDEDLTSHIIEKGGRKYFDISSVNKTELKLQKVSDVYGIVSEDGQNCRITKLAIAANYHVDRNIIKCHTLRNITLSGDWICGRDWSWLKMLKEYGIVLHSTAVCSDLKMRNPRGYSFKSLNFTEGISILRRLGIKDCPEKCSGCLTLLTREKIFSDHRVRCEKANFTDEDIPSIPLYTTQLYLEHNQLQSTQKLFSHLEHLENVTAVQLGWNMLHDLPFLKEKTFKKLNRLYLANNNIRKVDVEAFESIVSREDIVVDVQGNHFPCDCSSHFFLKLCLRYVTKVIKLIREPLQCVNESSNVKQVMTLRDDCEPKSLDLNDFMPLLLIFLAVMNIIFIYLVYDLVMAIRECRGQGSQIRDPKFHLLVMGTQRFFRFFKKNEKNRKEEEREGLPDTIGFRSHETPVTLRTNRLSSTDRELCVVRTDRRRLTPCPN